MSVKSFYVPMQDGVKLAIDLFLPEGLKPSEKIPTILMQTRYYRAFHIRWPYSLLGKSHRYEAWNIPQTIVSHGYAYVAVDVRGTGASFGCQTAPYPMDSVEDTREILDWITRQAWSNGRVGTFGMSYDASWAEMALITGHPSLKAALPAYQAFDLYSDIMTNGGVHLTWFLKNWGLVTRALDGCDLKLIGSTGKMVYGPLPVDDDKDKILLNRAIAEHSNNWETYDTTIRLTYRDDVLPYDPEWNLDNFSAATYKEQIDASGAAVLNYSGWYDASYPHAAVKRYLTLTNPNNQLVIGPWDHGGFHNTSPVVQKKQDFKVHFDTWFAFFDEYLKDASPTPKYKTPVRYFTMVEERWKESKIWPPPGAALTSYYLSPKNRLTLDNPTAGNTSDDYRVDYQAGTSANSRWRTLIFGNTKAGLYGERSEADRKLLIYQTDPFKKDTEVTGHPIVKLYVSTTVSDYNIFAYLEDVDEQGKVTLITEGCLRALHRKVSDDKPIYHSTVPYRTFLKKDAELVPAGEVIDLTFDLIPTSYLFRKGHSLRLAIAGADKDHFFSIPGPAPVLTIHHGADYPSRIEIPTFNKD